MSEQELIEKLSEAEHKSWSHWMHYLFSKCESLPDGSAVIPAELVMRWKQQTYTPYERLSEKEKQSDRDEVAHILPIIGEHMKQAATAISNAQMEQGGVCLHPNAMMRVIEEMK